MEIICGWCHQTMGEKPGRGTTHGICPACLQHELASLASYVEPLATPEQDLINCFFCHITASTAPLVLTDGHYACFPCLPRHRPSDFAHLQAWCQDKTPSSTY